MAFVYGVDRSSEAGPTLNLGLVQATGSRMCSAGFSQAKEFALSNPVNIIDFSSSLFPGQPAPNYFGLTGFTAGAATNPHELLRLTWPRQVQLFS